IGGTSLGDAFIFVSSGGTTVSSLVVGSSFFSNGAFVSGDFAHEGISGGGTALNVVAGVAGFVTVFSGGLVSNAQIGSGGTWGGLLLVDSGGIAGGTIAVHNAGVNLSSGGVLAGTLFLEGGTFASFDVNAVISGGIVLSGSGAIGGGNSVNFG